MLFPLNGEISFALFLCLLLVVCVVDVLILLYQDFEEDEIEVDWFRELLILVLLKVVVSFFDELNNFEDMLDVKFFEECEELDEDVEIDIIVVFVVGSLLIDVWLYDVVLAEDLEAGNMPHWLVNVLLETELKT